MDDDVDFVADVRPNASNMKRPSATATFRRRQTGVAAAKKHQQDDDVGESSSKRGEGEKKRQKRETSSTRKKATFDEPIDDYVSGDESQRPQIIPPQVDDEVNIFLKKKKAAAAASATSRRSMSQDSNEHLVQLGIDEVSFDDLIVESNLPRPSQNVDFIVAKAKKQMFEKLRENDNGRSTSYTMMDLPLTDLADQDTQKYACIKIACKMSKKMSKLLPKMEMDWNPGTYPVQAMVILRKGFDISPKTNSTVLELNWPAVMTLVEQGKVMIKFFDSKIAGKSFNSMSDIPLPKPAILQVNPRTSRGPQSVADVGTQVMLSMTAQRWGTEKTPKLMFNVREHYRDKETQEWKPARKGITLGHKAFHLLIHAFFDVSQVVIDAKDRFRARIDQLEEELDAELNLLKSEQKKKLVYDEEILFEENDHSQPIIEQFSSDSE